MGVDFIGYYSEKAWKKPITIQGCIQKFLDWLPGARNANDTVAVVSLFCKSV